jgi:hypothetical protein
LVVVVGVSFFLFRTNNNDERTGGNGRGKQKEEVENVGSSKASRNI